MDPSYSINSQRLACCRPINAQFAVVGLRLPVCSLTDFKKGSSHLMIVLKMNISWILYILWGLLLLQRRRSSCCSAFICHSKDCCSYSSWGFLGNISFDQVDRLSLSGWSLYPISLFTPHSCATVHDADTQECTSNRMSIWHEMFIVLLLQLLLW